MKRNNTNTRLKGTRFAKNSLREAAASYAQDLRLHVLPLKPRGKSPLVGHGYKDATTDARQIRAWWRNWPNANIGIACKASDLFVLDIDGTEGERALHHLESRFSPLPQTWLAKTANGAHVYFHAEGQDFPDTARKLGNGLDTRGRAGYIIAPPSIHETGRHYLWLQPPRSCDLAPVPEWLAKLLSAPKQRSTGRHRTRRSKSPTESTIPEGERNSTLATWAGRLLRRYVDPEDVLFLCGLINAGCCKPPLATHEVERIVDSICGAELRRRRGYES